MSAHSSTSIAGSYPCSMQKTYPRLFVSASKKIKYEWGTQ